MIIYNFTCASSDDFLNNDILTGVPWLARQACRKKCSSCTDNHCMLVCIPLSVCTPTEDGLQTACLIQTSGAVMPYTLMSSRTERVLPSLPIRFCRNIGLDGSSLSPFTSGTPTKAALCDLATSVP